jgi:hypothetical protein
MVGNPEVIQFMVDGMSNERPSQEYRIWLEREVGMQFAAGAVPAAPYQFRWFDAAVKSAYERRRLAATPARKPRSRSGASISHVGATPGTP